MPRLLAVALLFVSLGAHAATPGAIAWEPWSDDVFARAKREHRFVLLDLEAVWCHWCHVMDEVTYRDPRVVELVKARYIPVRVDQDSRPDISRRYENWGWPATVVFNAEGGEIVKRRGYLNPQVMTSILEAIILDPSPVRYGDNRRIARFAATPLLKPAVRKQLEQNFYDAHDPVLGGYRQPKKFMDWDTVEYALLRAQQGDARSATMARQTLDGALKLIDPAWGGAYQYSTDFDWDHPHYEKIMSVQAEYLRLYAIAYLQFNDARYLKAARDIHRFVKNFLTSPDDAFYTSQDADLIKGEHSGAYFALDDAGRRKLGVPAIDTSIYARENGWMIHALATLYTATGERRFLDDAIAAARWVIAHRAIAGGGFTHGAKDPAGPYLEDTLAMGRAFLGLYTASADREWLGRAEAAASFIEKNFRAKRQPGYVTSVEGRGSVLKPKTVIEENFAVVRFANLLARHTGDRRHRASAQYAMRFLATEEVALSRFTDPGILHAATELATEPLHVTVVGAKDDAEAAALYRAAAKYPSVYRRLEWWDKREGGMPNPDVRYPSLPRAAAFVCTNRTCSLPIYQPEGIAREVERAAEEIASAR